MGHDLYAFAQETAKRLLEAAGTEQGAPSLFRFFSRAKSKKKTTLSKSVFDVQLTVFFNEIYQHLGDKQIASAITDALLYDATGHEAGAVTPEQLQDEGTQHARGIQKYQLARKEFAHIGDTDGWTFGKEYSGIVSGSPSDIAYVVSVSPESLIIRVHSKWLIRELLYGTPPTRAEKEALDAALKRDEERLTELLKSLPKA
jgi:hypothetical protein